MNGNGIRSFLGLIIFVSLSLPSSGQSVSERDSLEIMKKTDIIFRLFKHPDFTAFTRISTPEIYCLLCSDKPDLRTKPYVYSRKFFFDSFLNNIAGSESFIRASASKDIVLFRETNRQGITAFYTIYQRNELAVGHEGAQFGIYFECVKGDYLFAGLETIP